MQKKKRKKKKEKKNKDKKVQLGGTINNGK